MDPDPVLPLIIRRLEDIGGSGSAHHQEEDQPPKTCSEQAMERSSSKSTDQTDENKEDETRQEGETSAEETTEKEEEEDGEETNQDAVIKDHMFYLPLYKDVERGDWESTKRVFDQDPTAITAGITSYMDTALHLAVRNRLPIQFVKNLVALMSEEDVATLDVDKNTALHCAGIVGYTEAAKILVEKNPRLTQLRDFANKTPLHWAAQYAHKPTVCYLLSVTRDEHPSPLTGERGAKLLNLLIIADFYDLAIHLLRRYPSIALERDDEGFTGLHRLALKPRAFLSGSQLPYMQRMLYKCWSHNLNTIYLMLDWFKSTTMTCKNGRARPLEDIENPASNIGCHLEEPTKIGYLQQINETMLMHKQALELTKLLCAETVKCRNLMKEGLFATPVVNAARMGISEIVSEIIKTFPDAVWCWDGDQRYIFHLAVRYRKEQVYNLMYQMNLQTRYLMSYTDKFWDNILHLAGNLGPSNRICGAALQMQRELQWFKEVENMVQPSFKEMKNKAGQTPREVFTEEHKDLVVKGEEWMKNTASSCTVVPALVVTVLFAAAFTLPGGNKSDGTPVYLHDLSFLIFTVSNALGLFSSSTSVLMFLGIITSRYSEEDFLRALPMKLCIGLITLFLSIAFMLAAFSCSVYLVLVHRLKWVAAPIILLAGIPVIIFGILQFPLLLETISPTFGPSIFRRPRACSTRISIYVGTYKISGTFEKFKATFEKALNAGEGFALASTTCSQSCMALFDEGCAEVVIEQADWDTSRVRDKLQRDIDSHITSVRAAKLSEITSSFEAKINDALSGPVEALLDGANNETWSSIRKLLRRETESAISGLSNALSGFDMDQETRELMLARLEDYARDVVEAKAKEEAGRILIRMKDRFSMLFSHDSDSMPRVWTGKEDIRAITRIAHSASLKLLSVMVAIRLDNEADNIEKTLSSALLDNKSSGAITERSITTHDPLASSTWEEIPQSKTLITPVLCKSLWRQFKSETKYSITQAISAQEANKHNNNWLPPPWAMVALLVLGFNEFMTLLRNPFYLFVIFVCFLLVKALWVQLDISAEFRNGALPGLISLSSKFLPTVMNILKRLAEEGQKAATNDPHGNAPISSKSFQNGAGTSTNMSSSASSGVTSSGNGSEYSSVAKEE